MSEPSSRPVKTPVQHPPGIVAPGAEHFNLLALTPRSPEEYAAQAKCLRSASASGAPFVTKYQAQEETT